MGSKVNPLVIDGALVMCFFRPSQNAGEPVTPVQTETIAHANHPVTGPDSSQPPRNTNRRSTQRCLSFDDKRRDTTTPLTPLDPSISTLSRLPPKKHRVSSAVRPRADAVHQNSNTFDTLSLFPYDAHCPKFARAALSATLPTAHLRATRSPNLSHVLAASENSESPRFPTDTSAQKTLYNCRGVSNTRMSLPITRRSPHPFNRRSRINNNITINPPS